MPLHLLKIHVLYTPLIKYIKQQQNHQETVLFIDEIHCFNKAQQDSLLPDIESGIITLIRTTTENPLFAINSALRSRLNILRLKPLSQIEIEKLLMRAITKDEYLSSFKINISDKVVEKIYHLSARDCRKALVFRKIESEVSLYFADTL